MAVERAAGGTSLIDVLDRVLDKGIVIDAWVRVSLVGIDLITVEARIVVASIDTYLKYSEAVGQVAPVSRPAAELPSHQEVVAENAALRAELAASKGSNREFAAAKGGLRQVAQSMARELGPKGIHVGHVVIDGRIGHGDNMLAPDAIADLYWQLHAQPRSAWTFEADLRPWSEKF